MMKGMADDKAKTVKKEWATHSNKTWQQREKKDFTKGIKKKGREHHASLTCVFG